MSRAVVSPEKTFGKFFFIKRMMHISVYLWNFLRIYFKSSEVSSLRVKAILTTTFSQLTLFIIYEFNFYNALHGFGLSCALAVLIIIFRLSRFQFQFLYRNQVIWAIDLQDGNLLLIQIQATGLIGYAVYLKILSLLADTQRDELAVIIVVSLIISAMRFAR